MKYIFFIVLFSVSELSYSQNYSSKNKKAIKIFEEGIEAPRLNKDIYGRENYSLGIEYMNKAIEKDPDFWEAYITAGEFAEFSNQIDLAIQYYEKTIAINPNHSPSGSTHFYLGRLKFVKGDYNGCLQLLQVYIRNRNANPEFVQEANRLMASAEFAIQSMKNPSNFNPINLGPAINTADPEYFPTLTVDGKTMLFTRRIKDNRVQGPIKEQEDFYISHLQKTAWTKAEPMPENINTVNNEGAPTISADGRTLVFIACPDASGTDYGSGRTGKGSCDMFVTKRLGSRWTNPINLPGYTNTSNWETQPSMSSDGKTIYFIRATRGANGSKNSDIYYANLLENGTWSQGIRLSSIINTPDEEESVLIHPDGKTLYFASRGHVGMGGSDLFMSRMDSKGNWGTPINLGYPINTKNDENSLMVNPDGEIAFFASDREGGYGNLDIYYFEMPEYLKPIKTLYFEGNVVDASTKRPIPGKFQLLDIQTGEEIIRSEADQITGEFLVSLPTNKEYALNVSYPGYNFYSKNFNMIAKENQEAVQLKIEMIPLGNPTPVLLANVFFDVNKTELRSESYTELNKLKDLLKSNTKLKIEIGGHTDTRGDADANQKLSEGRANSVRLYLIEQGIEAERLTAKGYGESQPKITDEAILKLETTAEQEKAHQTNRRTEYKFIAE
jgi:outer membrane protein OmpA-like peptidoglycan-associated protein/Tol biopolymer transport system component